MTQGHQFKQIAAAGLAFILLAGSFGPAFAERGSGKEGERSSREIELRHKEDVTTAEDEAHDSAERNLKAQGLDDSPGKKEQVKVKIASKGAELKLRQEDRKEQIQARLAGAKLQACQRRQDAIDRHAEHSAKTAAAILKKMESIANKATAFKDAKGISVEGLDSLEAAMATQKQGVVNAIQAANDSREAFDCESEGPKAKLQQFVASMDAVRQALKDYRSAIHNYIQAIRQANGQHRDGGKQATNSATPSATPSPVAIGSAEEAE